MTSIRVTRKCQFCGGGIGPDAGEMTGVMMHIMSVCHREAMTRSLDTVDPYPQMDPYVVPPFNEEDRLLGPMRHLLSGVMCQGCRLKVEVVIYVGRPASIHPDGSLACPGSGVAS